MDHRVFNTRAIVARDLNKDGSPDIVLLNDGQDSVALMGAPRADRGGGGTADADSRASGLRAACDDHQVIRGVGPTMGRAARAGPFCPNED